MRRLLSVSILALSLAAAAPAHAEDWFRLNISPTVYFGTGGQDGGPPDGGVNDSIAITVDAKVDKRVYGSMTIPVSVSGIDATYTMSVTDLPGAAWVPNGSGHGSGNIQWSSATQGTYRATIEVLDAEGERVASAEFEIVVHPQLTTAVAQTAYEVEVGAELTISPSTGNAIGAIQWGTVPAELPEWLDLDAATGAIAVGTAEVNALSDIMLTAVDQADMASASTLQFSVSVIEACDWTLRTAQNGEWSSVTYGNGQYVAVGPVSGGNVVMRSPNGLTWTSSSGQPGQWAAVAHGANRFVAVGPEQVMTSSDGGNWTLPMSPSGTWRSVTYGNGKFVAVAAAGTNRVMTSSDGMSWTTRAAPTRDWHYVTYANGQFVGVASGAVMTSPDGVTWTLRSAPPGSWRSVAYGNGQYVAVNMDGTVNPSVMTSPDGVNWTARTGLPGNWASVIHAMGRFMAVSYSGTNTEIMTSPDGVNWTARSAPSRVWRSVTFANGQFVAVGNNAVMTSNCE